MSYFSSVAGGGWRRFLTELSREVSLPIFYYQKYLFHSPATSKTVYKNRVTVILIIFMFLAIQCNFNLAHLSSMNFQLRSNTYTHYKYQTLDETANGQPLSLCFKPQTGMNMEINGEKSKK